MMAALDAHDFLRVALVGLLRTDAGIIGANPRRSPRARASWLGGIADDINGYAGEVLWARATGQRVNNAFGGGYRLVADVGDRDEVRTSQNPKACLIVHPESDRPGQRFALLVGKAPDLRPVGYFDAAARELDPRWKRQPDERYAPAYFIPQDELTPL